jgi:transcriptional regulator GlxA family with amidase domain
MSPWAGTLLVMDARVTAAISMIDRLAATQISIRAVSESVNLSPRRLTQLFKAETGISPRQYLRTLRMERARSLLQTSFLSVKEVTFHCGLSDVSHFVRNFKKHYGMTPSEFRVQMVPLSKASCEPTQKKCPNKSPLRRTEDSGTSKL